MMREAPPTMTPSKDWDIPLWDIYGRGDSGLILTSACSCAWPWSLTAIGTKLGFYPFTSRRLTFFYLMLFLVLFHYLTDSVANVMMAYSDTLHREEGQADDYEIVYMVAALIVSLTGVTICIIITQLRLRTRLDHHIPGDIVNDACYSCLCPCCVILQMGREVELQGDDVCTSAVEMVPPGEVKNEL